MSPSDRQLRADVADLAALIERAGADLALAEEPSNFAAALESGAEPEGGGRD
jgi:hypothetical protein